MWHPNPTAARLHHDKQLRTLYACLGASVALHGLAMFSFPALRPAAQPDDARALTALFASRSEPAVLAPAPPSGKPRERRSEPPAPVTHADPAPVAAQAAVESTPAPAPLPEPASAVASVSGPPAATQAPTQLPAELVDPSLFDAYRLALIDAAKRYKRYPAQAMERGWEGRVEIRVVVGANGMIKSVLVKRSSRYQILDDQALDMVKRAFNALDKPAPRGREFTVDVPVVFELQTG